MGLSFNHLLLVCAEHWKEKSLFVLVHLFTFIATTTIPTTIVAQHNISGGFMCGPLQ